MSIRSRPKLYAGAEGRIELSRIASLGERYVLQIKRDGEYVVVTTTADGSLSSMMLRSGNQVRHEIASEFRHVTWAPSAVVVGEIETFTDRADRAVAARGYRLIHLFDCLRIDDRDIAALPYQERRDALMRARSALVNADPDDLPRRLDTRTFMWSMPTDGASPPRHTPRPLAAPGAMRPGGAPLSWRRLPVVEQWPVSEFDRVWSDVEAADEEGVVVVALHAPVGKANAKRKAKRERTIDAVIVRSDGGAACLRWSHGEFVCSAKGKYSGLAVGTVVEVLCDHLDGRGAPKNPRIIRVRHDLGVEGLH